MQQFNKIMKGDLNANDNESDQGNIDEKQNTKNEKQKSRKAIFLAEREEILTKQLDKMITSQTYDQSHCSSGENKLQKTSVISYNNNNYENLTVSNHHSDSQQNEFVSANTNQS